MAGYADGQRQATLVKNAVLEHQDLVLSPVLTDDDIRIVLTWGQYPEDLEAHLTGPNPDGCRHHCFYWNKEIPGANLNPDSGLIRWTPSGTQKGTYYVTVRVADGRCGEDSIRESVYEYFQPGIQFSVSPCSGTNPGGDITLTWSTSLAETVFIDQGIGLVITVTVKPAPLTADPLAIDHGVSSTRT